MTSTVPKISARLVARVDVAEGLAILRFALSGDFHFKPGQYATLRLTHHGSTISRPYSIASSPSQFRMLEFYINLVKEGKLSPSFWNPEVLDALKNCIPDIELSVTGPKGRFVLDPDDSRDLVFVASGTGLAPFMSMIRMLNENYLADPGGARPRRIYVLHGVSISSHLAYNEELARLHYETQKSPTRRIALVYLPTISRPQLEPSWTGLKGRAETLLEPCLTPNGTIPGIQNNLKSILAVGLHPETHAVYVCGHPGTVRSVMKTLSQRGFRPDDDVKMERYYP